MVWRKDLSTVAILFSYRRNCKREQPFDSFPLATRNLASVQPTLPERIFGKRCAANVHQTGTGPVGCVDSQASRLYNTLF